MPQARFIHVYFFVLHLNNNTNHNFCKHRESEDGTEVWYYSTPLQVEELLSRLDGSLYEAELVDAIVSQKDEILRQMEITDAVTVKQNPQRRKTYLEAENGNVLSPSNFQLILTLECVFVIRNLVFAAFLKKINEERALINMQETEEKNRREEEERLAKKKIEDERLLKEEAARRKREEAKRKVREERLARRNKNKFMDPLEPNGDQDDDLESGDDEGFEDEGDQKTQDSETKSTEEPSSSTSLSEQDKNEQKNETNNKQFDSQISISEMDTQILPAAESEEVVSSAPAKSINDTPDATKKDKDVKSDDTLGSKTIVSKDAVEGTIPEKPKDFTPEKSGADKPILQKSPLLKSKALAIELDSEERMTRLKSAGLFKLGQEGSFRNYVNLFTNEPVAYSKAQHSEERDRKRQMSHKFSLTPASEIKYANQHGHRSVVVQTLKTTLGHIESAIPTTLMHVNWPQLKKAWQNELTTCVSASDFSKVMIMLTNAIRPSVFNSVWSEHVGHVRLMRMSALERDEKRKAEKKEKKDRDDEEDRLKLLPQFVKYSILPKHQVTFYLNSSEYIIVFKLKRKIPHKISLN